MYGTGLVDDSDVVVMEEDDVSMMEEEPSVSVPSRKRKADDLSEESKHPPSKKVCINDSEDIECL